MNTDFPLKAQDAIIGDVIIYPEMDMSRTVPGKFSFETDEKYSVGLGVFHFNSINPIC